MAARLLIFIALVELFGFQGYFSAGERGMGLEEVKYHEVHCSYQDLDAFFFFLMSIPWIVSRLWLISRVPKKLILTLFSSVLIAFMEGRISFFCHS